MKRITYLLVTLMTMQFIVSHAQVKMSPYSEVSILTIGPGEQLNDAFGHSGIRIKDPMYKLDVVFDYGRYDFSAEGFYFNFAKGKLDYQIGWTKFDEFISYYKTQKRQVDSQILNLSTEEIQQLFDLLQIKIQPQNKTYSYDFFYNNCATKIIDDLVRVSEKPIEFTAPIDFKPLTFRELIKTHIPSNSWGGFVIDLALGSVIDQQASNSEHMFLPSYLKTILGSSKFGTTSESVIKDTKILSQIQKSYSTSFWISPLLIFGILSILVLYITFKNYRSKRRSKLVDLLIFSFTGLIGIVIVFLWFFTDHTATVYNYNLLWAFVFNLFFLPTLLKEEVKIRFVGYLKFITLLLLLMVLHWITGVQSFNIAAFPILVALLVRYTYLIYWSKNNLKPNICD